MPEPISYTLRFPAPQTHYVEVEALVPTDGLPAVELMMAVWTPGSYLVREYSRNVESVSASTERGEPLPLEKTAKNRWRIATRKAPRIAVRYRLYSREMSVRTNWIDSDFALINGAPTFLTRAEAEKRPHDVRLVLPEGWKVSVSPLPGIAGEGGHAYRAQDFDTLVDSPLYAGNGRTYPFEAGGKPHVLLNEGEGSVWDGPRSAADAEKIVRAQIAFWGEAPYARYVFFNLLTEAGGGLEHRNACTLMSNRWRTRSREGYLDWLGLVSHELFHAWNGKRLRPAELGPFDYEREVYTRNLWVVEGITSYYGDLLVHRAGFSTRKQYLKNLSKSIETLQTTPGRLVQPMDEASFDAWIKLYRRDENTSNSGISYYTKGEVVAFLLDARIRRATGGRRSLDDALRLAYGRFSGERGFTDEEFHRVLEEVAGTGLEDWLARAVETTAELDYQEALDWYGLRFASGEPEKKEGGEPQELPAGWLGMDVEAKEGRLVVTQVKRGTPAYEAGVNVDDEILAIDDYRVPPDGIENRLKSYRPGEKATLLVARRDRLTRLAVTFGEKPKNRWKLEARPDATEEQKAHLAAWLADAGSPAEKEEEKAPATAAVP
ncbi:MAG TPA: PDZ domain-containing protein [Thermoanaerobaculia bacterium]|jgi:predicted metalloprotease with PDZ domain|nr:PDZ domain-containing protein [Thermoanaerobaculia bacterium]